MDGDDAVCGETLSGSQVQQRSCARRAEMEEQYSSRATKRRPESGSDVTQRTRSSSPAYFFGIKVYFEAENAGL